MKNQKGFTLVELLVVIAIIGILAVLAVPALFRNIEKAKIAELETDYSAVKSAALSYYTDNKALPTKMEDLEPYMESVPKESSLGGKYALGVTYKEDMVFLVVQGPFFTQTIKLTEYELTKLVKDVGNNTVTSTDPFCPSSGGYFVYGHTPKVYYEVVDNKLVYEKLQDNSTGPRPPGGRIHLLIKLLDMSNM